MSKVKLLCAGLLILSICAVEKAPACTAMGFPNSSDYISAGNFDWLPNSPGVITVNKRGFLKSDVDIYGDGLPKLQWRSKYGSVSSSLVGAEFPMGGVNEQGLSIQLLQGEDTVFPEANGLPSLYFGHVGQYLLDMAGSLDEAMELLSKIRVYGRPGGTAHFFVCDQKFHCAVVEFLKGKTAIFRNAELPIPVITNNTYEKSLAQYHECVSSGCSLTPSSSLERFVESAKALVAKNKQPVAQSESVDYFSRVSQSGPRMFTLYSVGFPASSANARRMDIYSRKGVMHQWIDFSKLDFSCHQPLQIQDVAFDQNGEKSKFFQNYSVEFQRKTAGEFYKNLLPPAAVEKLVGYPGTIKDCK